MSGEVPSALMLRLKYDVAYRASPPIGPHASGASTRVERRHSRLRRNYYLFREEGQSARDRARRDFGVLVTNDGLILYPHRGGGTRLGKPVDGDPRQHFRTRVSPPDVRNACNVAPSSSSQGYPSVHCTSFSYIHASNATGESASAYPSVCGCVFCSWEYPQPFVRNHCVRSMPARSAAVYGVTACAKNCWGFFHSEGGTWTL